MLAARLLAAAWYYGCWRARQGPGRWCCRCCAANALPPQPSSLLHILGPTHPATLLPPTHHTRAPLPPQVDWLTEKMRQNNFTVSAMHGDMPQKEREAIMDEFRKGATRVLITTDVWARGLDVQQVRGKRRAAVACAVGGRRGGTGGAPARGGAGGRDLPWRGHRAVSGRRGCIASQDCYNVLQ